MKTQERPRGNEYRTTIVCVDSYDNGVLAGRFYNPAMEGEVPFRSWSQFFVSMEGLLDDIRTPQSFTAARSFRQPAQSAQSAQSGEMQDIGSKTGRLGTFAVRVLFRQNASWQGSVAWLEGSQEESFRSVLELILLMNSALQRE